MADPILIDTLEFGNDGATAQKYEIYGDDEQRPAYALIYRQDQGEWIKLDETLEFAAREEQKAASSTMDYGSSDGLPELRDLPGEAKERCKTHWQENQGTGDGAASSA
ncbi:MULTISPECIES: hypothetical protein [unclassified Enterobacter]|uniref:hypothetical protein n=1 Tax=unclassified Enterobacter TaxID=2608935 RepID=UPI000933A607|nr:MULTISPECIES: hypothetical protein [unclassified Enterobacter]WJD48492.1 hypothetical protein QRD42_14500 [Enterobacter sp. PGRG2]